jgi:hypothetical protein
MGNRGCLHDAYGHVTKRSIPSRKSWIYCVLEFGDRKRPLAAPGKYTVLFFLDEATALAAGHRPCKECQNKRYGEFVDGWTHGNAALSAGKRATAAVMDELLQNERLTAVGSKPRVRASDLPDGCMVSIGQNSPHLVWQGMLLPWSFEGYGSPVAPPPSEVTLITPASTVKAFRAGFNPTRAVA